MKVSEVHPSHRMQLDDDCNDAHADEVCEVCKLAHCYLCKDGEGLDDDELKEPCAGFNVFLEGWYNSEGRRIGRRSGTGWV